MPISPTLPHGFHSDADLLNSQPARRPAPAFLSVVSAEAYRAQSRVAVARHHSAQAAERARLAETWLPKAQAGGWILLVLGLLLAAYVAVDKVGKAAPVEVASADKPLFV